MGGVRVHRETLYASTGVELDCLPGHSIVVPDLDDVYTRAYHAAFQNHLQRLIRVLDLHYNDQGWAIVRKHLMQTIPKDHALYNAWLSPERKTLLSKSFLRMRIARMDRFVRELFSNFWPDRSFSAIACPCFSPQSYHPSSIKQQLAEMFRCWGTSPYSILIMIYLGEMRCQRG